MTERFIGRVVIADEKGRTAFNFNAEEAALDVGSDGNEGDLRLRDGDGKVVISLNAGEQTIRVNDAVGQTVLWCDANLGLLDVGPGRPGGETQPFALHDGVLRIIDRRGRTSIHLDGGTGDIRLLGADCAEDFDVAHDSEATPGLVMTIGDEGRLRPCDTTYDRRVAGVVSGAGDFRSGIVLDSRPNTAGRTRIALTGKVHCWVDATHEGIGVGDLLTTSSTRGHAMRAGDRERAFGATLGKALRPLPAGTGLLPVLVALQ